MSLIRVFDREFKKMEDRGWEKIYVFVDIHETIILPTYEMYGDIEFYPYAKDTLQMLTKSKEVSLGLYTCSYPQEIEVYLKKFKEHGIEFEHVNINNEVRNNEYGCFDYKPYYNVLLEDKAGFIGDEDWAAINIYFKRRRK